MEFNRNPLTPEEVADNHLRDFDDARTGDAWLASVWFMKDGKVQYRRTSNKMPEAVFFRMTQQLINDLLPESSDTQFPDTSPIPDDPLPEAEIPSVHDLLDCDHLTEDCGIGLPDSPLPDEKLPEVEEDDQESDEKWIPDSTQEYTDRSEVQP